MELLVNVAFTDAAMAQVPPLSALRFQLQLGPSRPGLLGAVRGDKIRLQGMPTEPPLYVVGRAWTVMQDEDSLLLVLGLASEL